MTQVAADRRAWDTRDVLAVVALIGGPFLLPVVLPLLGIALAATSRAWSLTDLRRAAVLAMLPLLAVIVWVVSLQFGSTAHALLGLVAVVAVNCVAPPLAGLLLLLRRT